MKINKNFIKIFLIIIFSLTSIGSDIKQLNTYDVIVIGAGTGGVSASIQASRLGASVLLIEETDWIGGQMTSAGVTSMDGNYNFRGGIYKEFTDKIILHYIGINKTYSGCYWSQTTICFEPHVGHNILKDMVEDEPNLTVLLNTKFISLTKDSNERIESVITNNGTFYSSIVIDATEYGDVILTEDDYRVGNKTKETQSSTSCIQDITYTAVIKEYPLGIPTELQITEPLDGYEDIAPFFRQRMINNPSLGSSWNGLYPINFEIHNNYRRMPNSSSSNNNTTKTSLNWFNDWANNNIIENQNLSSQYVYDAEYREEQNCLAKERTFHLLYYIQNELGKNWSVSTDEGYSNSIYNQENLCSNIPENLKTIELNFPIIPYVREGARGIGMDILTAEEIWRAGNPPRVSITRYEDSIAIGDYGNDLHTCSENNTLELDFEQEEDKNLSGVFQVPFDVLISENDNGLIFAEKNLSVTRYVNGSIRLQPITMIIGQASGTIAYLASRDNVSPSEVSKLETQRILLETDSTLFPYQDMNSETEFFADMQMMSARGIMNGYSLTSFGTNDNLNRAQMAILIVKSFNLPISNPVGIFQDVPINNSFSPYIESLYNHGITAGCSSNPLLYCPNNSITNSQLSIFIFRAWKIIDPTIELQYPQNETFSDLPNSHSSYPYTEALIERGLLWKCSSVNFCPSNPVKRNVTAYILNYILSSE